MMSTKPLNTFFGNKFPFLCVLWTTDGSAKVSMARTTGATFERKVFHTGGDILFRCVTNGIAAMPNNVFFSGMGNVIWERLADYGTKARVPLDLRDGNVIADSLFVNAKRNDFRFKPNSSVLKLGAEPFKPARAGRSKAP